MNTEFINGKTVQPVEGIDCDKCLFKADSADTCYAFRCVSWRREDEKHVYYVEIESNA